MERLKADVLPHMGWNTVEAPAGTRLFAGVEDERFYFVHSYAARSWDLVTNDRTAAPLVTWAEHGGDRFVAAVENGPLCATQFHPEMRGFDESTADDGRRPCTVTVTSSKGTLRPPSNSWPCSWPGRCSPAAAR